MSQKSQQGEDGHKKNMGGGSNDHQDNGDEAKSEKETSRGGCSGNPNGRCKRARDAAAAAATGGASSPIKGLLLVRRPHSSSSSSNNNSRHRSRRRPRMVSSKLLPLPSATAAPSFPGASSVMMMTPAPGSVAGTAASGFGGTGTTNLDRYQRIGSILDEALSISDTLLSSEYTTQQVVPNHTHSLQ